MNPCKLFRATETIRDINIIYVNDSMTFTEEDSTIAAQLMKDQGVPCVAVLGGDGTNRAVTKGWMDIPVIPISTGTNNAFPVFIEPTVAGTALGPRQELLKMYQISQNLIHIADNEGDIDLALIDAVAVDDNHWVIRVFDPQTMVLAILKRPYRHRIFISRRAFTPGRRGRRPCFARSVRSHRQRKG